MSVPSDEASRFSGAGSGGRGVPAVPSAGVVKVRMDMSPAARSTVQLSAYVAPELIRDFDAAASITGYSRSTALRLAAEDFIAAVDASRNDDAPSDRGDADTPTGGRSEHGLAA